MMDFPSDDELVTAWESGLVLAQEKLTDVGITPATPDADDPGNNWFYHPHILLATTDRAVNQHEMDEEIGGEEILEEVDVQTAAPDQNDNDAGNDDGGENFASMSDAHPELCDHLAQVINSVESEESSGSEDQSQDPGQDTEHPVPVSNTIPIPEFGNIHKSTIISKLNANPTGQLLWDRCLRVRSRQQVCNSSRMEDGSEVGLFDDVAVSSKSAVNKHILGRIIRMRNKERGVIEYHKPIDLNDAKKYPKVALTINLYAKDGSSYKRTDSNVEVLFKDVIMKVKLDSEDTNESRLVMSQHDTNALSDFVSNTRSVQGSATNRNRNRNVAPQAENVVPDDGRIRISVSPVRNAADDNIRRSTRRRNIQIWAYD